MLSQCVLIENSADTGGGAYLYGSSVKLEHCTLTLNSAQEAGGIYVQGTQVKVFDSILWNNSPQEIFGKDPNVQFSNVDGGWSGAGNIEADPRFCEARCSGIDLGLAVDSPCAGTGQGGTDMGALPPLCDAPRDAPAEPIRVPDDQPTLSAALASACERDTIVLAPGTYREHHLDVETRRVVIRCEDPDNPATVAATVISGDSLGPVLLFEGAHTGRRALLGVTLRGGAGEGERGGGITCTSAARPVVSRCVITDNTAYAGAGIRCIAANPTLEDCTISGNHSKGTLGAGGGVCCEQAQPILRRCAIEANRADFRGGGIDGVDSSPRIEACRIAGAIDAAALGDSVVVAPGTYLESSIDFSGKAIAVSGSAPLDSAVIASTVVDGGGDGSVFLFRSGEGRRAVLAGLTIRGGFAEQGAGALIEEAGPSVVHCVFEGNLAAGDDARGGGVHADGGTPIFLDCTFRGNSATTDDSGARAAGGGVSLSSSVVSLQRCRFESNQVFGGYARGAGLAAVDSEIGVTDCDILRNETTGGTTLAGGGIHAEASTIVASGCTMEGNRSSDGAGFALAVGCEAHLEACTVNDNIGSGTAGIGLGGSLRGASATLEGCEISGNWIASWDTWVCTTQGGGLSVTGGSLTLLDCIVSDNLLNVSCMNGGAGVAAVNSDLNIKSSTVTNNGGTDHGSSHQGSGGGHPHSGGDDRVGRISTGRKLCQLWWGGVDG